MEMEMLITKESIFRNGKILLLLMILLQVIVIAYWGSQKENYYWDEYFTLERAHYVSDSTPYEHYFNKDEQYIYNVWIPTEIVKKTLSVSEQESVLMDNPVNTIKKMFETNSYSVLLNIVSVLICEGKVSVWPAIVLNLILFIINQLILFKIADAIFGNAFLSTAVVAFYGFSCMCISMTIFIRFYMFATLMVTLFVFFHIKHWRTKDTDLVKSIFFELIAFLFLFEGYLNAQFVIIFGAFFSICYAALTIIDKKIKAFVFYFFPVFTIGMFFLIKEGYISVLINFFQKDKKQEYTTGALGWVVNQIYSFRVEMLPNRVRQMFVTLGYRQFGHKYIIIVFFAFLLILLCINIYKKRKVNTAEMDLKLLCVLFASIMLFLSLFTALFLYEQPRYISFVFPELAVLIVAVLNILILNKLILRGSIVIWLIIIVCIESFTSCIDMIYLGDAEQIQSIKETGVKSIMVSEGIYQPFTIYQAVMLEEEPAEVMVYDGISEKELLQQARNPMLVVIVKDEMNEDYSGYKSLKKNGYNLEYIGETYMHRVFKSTK